MAVFINYLTVKWNRVLMNSNGIIIFRTKALYMIEIANMTEIFPIKNRTCMQLELVAPKLKFHLRCPPHMTIITTLFTMPIRINVTFVVYGKVYHTFSHILYPAKKYAFNCIHFSERNKLNIKIHMRDHHIPTLISEPVQCKICGKMLKNWTKYITHKRDLHSSKGYKTTLKSKVYYSIIVSFLLKSTTKFLFGFIIFGISNTPCHTNVRCAIWAIKPLNHSRGIRK